MSEPEFTSALAGLKPAAGLAISISEIVDLGMIDVRADAGDKDFRTAFTRSIGCDVATEPRSSRQAGDCTVLWLSIDQWLVLVPRRNVKDIVSSLRSALRDQHALAIDLSDARTVIRLEGKAACEILMKGAPVDLTDGSYGKGSVRRLRLGEIAALVYIRSIEPEIIDLFVFRSYARFAWDWLEATAGEAAAIGLFGPQSAPPVV